jgi:hypothetical protein
MDFQYMQEYSVTKIDSTAIFKTRNRELGDENGKWKRVNGKKMSGEWP